jgi:hypothetical protein
MIINNNHNNFNSFNPFNFNECESEIKKEKVVSAWNGKEIIRELERVREEIDSESKPTNELGKAITIMMRIIRGDIVPDRDDRFLLENYPDMHMRAWLLRRQNDDPVEHESLLEDDDSVVVPELPSAVEVAGIDVKV